VSSFVDDWLGPRRFNLGLFGAFASTARLLAVLGLYGLVSYAVNQRALEIGLRMAIGATQGGDYGSLTAGRANSRTVP
jgi:ABC-type antimicrobial peptide transport system permease subunit